MASSSSAEFDKLINELEYDIKQYLKEVEKEKQSIHYIEECTKNIQQELDAEQKMTPYLDQSVKSYHKLFTINRDMINSTQSALESSKIEAENLSHQLEKMKKGNEEEYREHEAVLQHYQQKWEDYKESYEGLPLAKQVADMLKQKEELLLENKEKLKELECLKQEKERREQSMSGIGWMEFIVKLAPLRLEALKLQKQVSELEEKCQTLQEDIKLKREEKAKLQQEGEEMRSITDIQKKDDVNELSQEDEQTNNHQAQQREEHKCHEVLPEQLQNAEEQIITEQQQQQQRQQQQQQQQQQQHQQQQQERTTEDKQRIEQKENMSEQKLQRKELEQQIIQQDQQRFQQQELMMEKEQTTNKQCNQNKIYVNMPQTTRGIGPIQNVELTAANSLEIPKLRFPQIKAVANQSVKPTAIRLPSIQLAIPRLGQQTPKHSYENQTPRTPQVFKLPQITKLPERSAANILIPDMSSTRNDMQQSAPPAAMEITVSGISTASASSDNKEGDVTTQSDVMTQGDVTTRSDVMTPGREHIKDCALLTKTPPSISVLNTDDTDITDIESQLKKIKMLTKQSPGFTYGPGQPMYENKNRTEEMEAANNLGVFDFSGEQFFQPLFGAAPSSNAGGMVTLLTNAGESGTSKSNESTSGTGFSLNTPIQENSSTTAFNFNDQDDTDKLTDTHACILTLFGDKETDNRTNTNDQSEQSFFNFGNTSTDELSDFQSSTFSLF